MYISLTSYLLFTETYQIGESREKYLLFVFVKIKIDRIN